MLQVSLLLEFFWLNGCFFVTVSSDLLDLEEKEVGVWR